MDKLKTCLSCKRLFKSPFDRELCPECYKVMEERFDRVRRYVKNNKDNNVEEVSLACHISKKQILKWVREERLYFSPESGVGVPCIQCGIVIQSGRYCKSCKAKLRKEMESIYVEPEVEDSFVTKKTNSSKMRFLSKGTK